MILECGIVNSPEEVIFYSGLIESLFAILGLVTGMLCCYSRCHAFQPQCLVLPWTYASDRFGRKPVVLYGAVGMAISTAGFGFSKTYGMMIIIRCLGGAFAGTRSCV